MAEPSYMKDTYCRLRDSAIAAARDLGAGRLAEVAAGAPDIIYTLFRLMRDGRVPKRAKFKLGLAAAYLAMPLDALPFGVLDDVYVALMALALVMDDIGEEAMAEYWPGDTAELRRFKALMDSLNERFGAGAVRRLAGRLGVRVEVEIA